MTCTAIVLMMSLTAAAALIGTEPATRSPTLAAELNGLLSIADLDAIAAVDPDHPDRFIAALLVPRVQLLVVDAKAATPAVASQRIAAKQFRDVYSELQRTESSAGRLFVYDLDANGLTSEGGDVVYESGAVQTIFNGHPAAQQLNDATYRQRLHDADQRYSRMLSVLINALKQSPSL
jgi:hypothetical protein